MNSHKATEALQAIGTLSYLNANNLSVLVSPNATTKEGIDKNSRRLLRILMAENLIEPVLDKYEQYRHTPKQFYRPSRLGVRKLDIEIKYIRQKGVLKEEHDSMKQDILIAIYTAYGDKYQLHIKHEPRLGGYTPDALLQMEGADKKHIFYVEMERKTSVRDIIKRKISVMEKFRSPKGAKHLIVVATHDYPAYARHIEFSEPRNQKLKGDIKKIIFRIIAEADLDDRFLFMPYPNYYRLARNPKEAVCYDHKGNLRPLIY